LRKNVSAIFRSISCLKRSAEVCQSVGSSKGKVNIRICPSIYSECVVAERLSLTLTLLSRKAKRSYPERQGQTASLAARTRFAKRTTTKKNQTPTPRKNSEKRMNRFEIMCFVSTSLCRATCCDYCAVETRKFFVKNSCSAIIFMIIIVSNSLNCLLMGYLGSKNSRTEKPIWFWKLGTFYFMRWITLHLVC